MKGHHLPIFLTALGASVVLHAAAFTGTRVLYVRGHDGTASAARQDRRSVALQVDADGMLRDDPVTPPAAPPPTPPADAVPPPPPPVAPQPPEPIRPDVEKFPDRVGTNDGQGIGSHPAEGKRPLQAPHADTDQPMLSLDPRGSEQRVPPTPNAAPQGDGGSGGQSGGPKAPRAEPTEEAQPTVEVKPAPPAARPAAGAVAGEFRPGPVAVRVPSAADGVESNATRLNPDATALGPVGPAVSGADPDLRSPERSPADTTIRPDGLLPPPPPARAATSPPPAPPPLRAPLVAAANFTPAVPAPPTPPPTPAVRPRPAGGDGGRPGDAAASADAAQESDSEVDAFSRIETFVRRDGSVDPQFGRKVKTRRPDIPIPGLIDAALGARSVTLKVSVSKTGDVSSVKVHRSSGSRDIDQPCLLSVYDWWFEPLKDKAGNPRPDVVFFTINFR